MTVFHGISAFPITPTSPQGQVRQAALEGLLDRLVRSGVDAIGVLGSTGGYAYLTLAERQRVLELAVARTRGKVALMCGVGALRTDDAILLARHAAGAGADGLLLAPVSYTPLTEDEVFAHFAAVAEATPVPLCIYNNPSTTHFTVSQSLLARLATLPTVCAVKMPLPADDDPAAEIARLRAALPAGFVIGYSGDWGAMASLLAGADSFFSVAAGLLPDPFLRLGRAAIAGDADGSARLNADFAPLWDLFREFGSLRVIYAAARLMRLTDALPPRPLLALPESYQPRVRLALEALGVSPD
ncbi:dihydrodipicolinate synthase family protein [Paracoccus salsus]|uniref:dihydrodipicolinate synthase family protein n=1 Tax=Paracoccus salsus TaxID=2911061 RepID=UPI001F369F3E|nr:dihydrodipicolinate synthase family protein [Paracoccus salsus]MCF3972163.1 dihydrodipicolinate synthase family protein [Paracoccus salsus]